MEISNQDCSVASQPIELYVCEGTYPRVQEYRLCSTFGEAGKNLDEENLSFSFFGDICRHHIFFENLSKINY